MPPLRSRPRRLRPTPGASLLTPGERRARTAALLDQVCTTADALERRRLLVSVALLNLPVADAIAHRFAYRHPAVDQLDLVDCARQALLQAVTEERPRPGDDGADLLARVVPVVRRAARDHVRSLGLPSLRMLYADSDDSGDTDDRGDPGDPNDPHATAAAEPKEPDGAAPHGLLELAEEFGLSPEQLSTLGAVTRPTTGAGQSGREAWRAVLAPDGSDAGAAVEAALRMARDLPAGAKWVLCVYLADELASSREGVLPRGDLAPFAERILTLLGDDPPEPKPPDAA